MFILCCIYLLGFLVRREKKWKIPLSRSDFQEDEAYYYSICILETVSRSKESVIKKNAEKSENLEKKDAGIIY